MRSSFFIPFNVRNQIIDDNPNKENDIEKLDNHYQLLTSYMKEKQMFNGINHRIGRAHYSKARVNFTMSNSIEAFKKNQTMTRYDYLTIIGRKHE